MVSNAFLRTIKQCEVALTLVFTIIVLLSLCLVLAVIATLLMLAIIVHLHRFSRMVVGILWKLTLTRHLLPLIFVGRVFDVSRVRIGS